MDRSSSIKRDLINVILKLKSNNSITSKSYTDSNGYKYH